MACHHWISVCAMAPVVPRARTVASALLTSFLLNMCLLRVFLDFWTA